MIRPITRPSSTTGTTSTRWCRKISATWVSEKSGADVDVLGGHVLADRLAAAGVALLERLVERASQERGAAELVEVAGEQRAHELALAEDAGEALALVDDRQRRQVALEQPADRGLDRVVGVQQRRLAQDEAR